MGSRRSRTATAPSRPGAGRSDRARADRRASGGRAYRAPDSATLGAIYSTLAKVLGHHRVEQLLTGFFAGAGLLLVALAVGLSLLWFARLA